MAEEKREKAADIVGRGLTPFSTRQRWVESTMLKNVIIGVLAATAALETLALYDLSMPPAPALAKHIAYSDFIHETDAGRVSSVSIQGSELTGMTKENQRFRTYLPEDPALVPRLVSENVRVAVLPTTESPSAFAYLLQWVPILLVTGVWGWHLGRISRAVPGVSAAISTLPGKPAIRDEP